ncbi:MAG TPA: CopD family protein [Rhodopila sp.]|uniref:CopD family protein n=1 Tax=Rhodopila sp. TaxID=2480087 RepID=UPI002B77916B|nr:CopD family protein [Rhodopila sp.]HVY15531.1 CopD family protein [Rhodopila sp.]
MQAAIILSRGLHLAGMLSFLGVAAFRTLVLPAASDIPASLRGRVDRLGWVSLVLAIAAGGLWLAVEAASMAGAASVSETLRALPLVAEATRFGQVMMARFALLLFGGLAFRWWRWPALGFIVLAAALQGLMAHAGAAEGDGAPLVAEALHLPAAGIWFGSLLPLFLSVGKLAPADGAAVCERFTPIGLACVLVIGVTGTIQAITLVGSVPGLVGTPYGHIVLLKLGLFTAALGLALLNRLWLTDRLAADGRAGPLRLSVATEALLGCGIVLAAGWLASGMPAIDRKPVRPASLSWSIPRRGDPSAGYASAGYGPFTGQTAPVAGIPAAGIPAVGISTDNWLISRAASS